MAALCYSSGGMLGPDYSQQELHFLGELRAAHLHTLVGFVEAAARAVLDDGRHQERVGLVAHLQPPHPVNAPFLAHM